MNNIMRDEMPTMNDDSQSTLRGSPQPSQDGKHEGKKRRAFNRYGCLCICFGYYVLASFLLGDTGRISWTIHWTKERAVEFFQLPFLWPLLITGWTFSRASKSILAILAYVLYFWFAWQIVFPKSMKTALFSILGLSILVLVSFGGCIAGLSHAID